MAIALSGDAKIYYEVHGSGSAVMLVHGSGGHHAAWWQQVAALSPGTRSLRLTCGASETRVGKPTATRAISPGTLSPS